MSDATWVLGLDSCKGGWAGIGWSGSDVVPLFGVDVKSIAHAFAASVSALACVGIDIPIGLPDAGPRVADQMARDRLVGRASSVFSTPTRRALQESDYQRALVVQRDLTGAGMSKQAFALGRKILDVDGWLLEAPCPVVEVHPEVSFAAINGAAVKESKPVKASKKTWAGFQERMRLLESVGLVVPSDVGALGGRAGPDDVLDAAVVAWTAMRVARGEAESLPDPPEEFSDGWPAAIWF